MAYRNQVRGRPLPNRTEFINFSERDFIGDNSSLCLLILSAIDLQSHVFFSFEKVLLNPSLYVDSVFEDVGLAYARTVA